MKKIITIPLLLMILATATAQSNQQYFLYNTLFSGVSGSIGSMIHRNDKTLAKAALDGFIKGSLGGAVIYGAKYSTRYIDRHKSQTVGWVSHLLSATGSSMLDNAFHNQKLFSKWEMELYGFRLTYTDKMQVRLQPFATYGMIRSAIIHEFDLAATLRSSYPIFRTSKIRGYNASGLNIEGSISIRYIEDDQRAVKVDESYKTLGHEIIHSIQRNQSQFLNTTMTKVIPLNKYLYFDYRWYAPALLLDRTYIEQEAEHLY